MKWDYYRVSMPQTNKKNPISIMFFTDGKNQNLAGIYYPDQVLAQIKMYRLEEIVTAEVLSCLGGYMMCGEKYPSIGAVMDRLANCRKEKDDD